MITTPGRRNKMFWKFREWAIMSELLFMFMIIYTLLPSLSLSHFCVYMIVCYAVNEFLLNIFKIIVVVIISKSL